MKLIWQLLRQHVSVLQLAGFLVTNLVGVAIVLTAVQLYRDVTPALQAPDSFLDNDFIILTKEVEGPASERPPSRRRSWPNLRSSPSRRRWASLRRHVTA